MFLLETISLLTQMQCIKNNYSLPMLENKTGYEVINCFDSEAFELLSKFVSVDIPHKVIQVIAEQETVAVTIEGGSFSDTHEFAANFNQPIKPQRGRQLQIAIEAKEAMAYLENQLTDLSQACNIQLVDISSNEADIIFTTSIDEPSDTSYRRHVLVCDTQFLPDELPTHWLATPCFDSDIVSVINEFRLTTAPRILLADDSPSSLLTTHLLLESLHCEVSTASDGKKALELIQNHEYDFVVLDERMPGLKGSEVIQSMRKAGYSAQSIAVALSGMTDEKDVAYLKHSGFEKHLGKPVKRQALEQLLDEWKNLII